MTMSRAIRRLVLVGCWLIAAPALAEVDGGAVDAGAGGAASGDGGGATSLPDAQVSPPLGLEDAGMAVLSPREELAKFNNTELMKYGVTAGFAVALQTQLTHRSLGGANVNPGVKPALIGYGQVNPGYWGGSQATREACSSQWSNGDEADSTIAAHAVERENARETLASIVGAWRQQPAGRDIEGAADDIAALLQLTSPEDRCHSERCKKRQFVAGQKALQFHNIILRAREIAVGTTENLPLRLELIEAIASTAWISTLRAHCFWKRFGVWAGWAFEYASPNYQSKDSKTSGPAFGVAYSPFAQVSILLGFTRGSLTRPVYRDMPVWAFTAAVGGNLDILTSVGKILIK